MLLRTVKGKDMKACILTLGLAVALVSCAKLPLERNCTLTADPSHAYTAYVLSSQGCGFCRRAYKQIPDLDTSITVTALLIDDIRQEIGDKYPQVTFSDLNKCDDAFDPKMIPHVLLLNRAGDVVFRSKGWAPTSFAEARAAMDRGR